MKRALADVLLLATVCLLVLVVCGLLVVALQVPNTVGLDRTSVMSYGTLLLAFLGKNKAAAIAAVAGCLGIVIAVKVMLYVNRREVSKEARHSRQLLYFGQPRAKTPKSGKKLRLRRRPEEPIRSMSPRHKIS